MNSKSIIEAIIQDEALSEVTKKDIYPFPKPFCLNINKVAAFVLGADPSNFSDNGNPVILDHVFGIGSGDDRYFRDILNNLEIIGLDLKSIYVQNLVRNYMKLETSSNKQWAKFAEYWIEALKDEFDAVDKSSNIPVFVTAYQIYDFLLNEGVERFSAESIYNGAIDIPIGANKTKLGRPMIPLFRHYKYKLTNSKWSSYVREVQSNIIN